MASFPDLYVLRHGQTTWNADGRLQGALNSPLTDLGHTQARAQRAILETRDLSGFEAIASPLGRTIETAGIAVAPLVNRIRTDARLREIEVGDWSGLLRDDLGVAYDATQPPGETLSLYESAPGGEGLARLGARCEDFLQSLDAPAILITHGITSRMLRALWLGLGQESLSTMPGGQGNVFWMSDGAMQELTRP
ncbi:MAG: histidine phosphatase family protein [Pseudomonadota bacterium]